MHTYANQIYFYRTTLLTILKKLYILKHSPNPLSLKLQTGTAHFARQNFTQ